VKKISSPKITGERLSWIFLKNTPVRKKDLSGPIGLRLWNLENFFQGQGWKGIRAGRLPSGIQEVREEE
jgi:hypothetical protein